MNVDGGNVGVGDHVGFKDDIEQYGRIVKIDGQRLTLSVFDGMTGDCYEVEQHSSRIWFEG